MLRVLALLVAVVASHSALAAGLAVMHGFADQSGITLWTQADRAARIVVDVHPVDDPRATRRVETAARAEEDFVAPLRLANLKPGTRYAYRILVDGRPAHSSTFATQPLWQFRADPPELALAFGSCAYVNDEFSRARRGAASSGSSTPSPPRAPT